MKGKVFWISAGKFVDGISRTWTFVEVQARSLVDLGWTIELSVVDDRTSIRGVARNLRRLRNEVARSGAVLVHAQYGSVTAAIAAGACGARPLVISFCGEDLLGTPEPGLIWRMRTRASRSIGLGTAMRADSIVVKSRNLLLALPQRLRDRAEIIPNGVDERMFAPVSRGCARSKLGWDERHPVVLFYGGASDHRRGKNLSLALATMTELRKKYASARLETLTDTPQLDVALKMNASDCLLVTSLVEGSPNVVKEAMACNLPVVTVPCGDVSERLAGVRPGDVADYDAPRLATCIADVLEQSSRSNGREALERQGLTARSVAARLSGLYDRLVREFSDTCAE